MLADSYFYPGFFSDTSKHDISRGPLAFIIKNYILRCDNIPRLIAYTQTSTSAAAYFATEAGYILGSVQYEQGYNTKYKMYASDAEIGHINNYNLSLYAESAKSGYVVSAITKDRARAMSPAKRAKAVTDRAFSEMMRNVLYKHMRHMRKNPEPPATLSLEDTAQIAPILLNGDSPLTMPANVRAKVERIHSFMNLKTDMQTGWANHVQEMFGREKWVVMAREFIDGTKVWTVGVMQLPPDVLNAFINKPEDTFSLGPRIQITQPFTTYRHMAALPDELLAMMTMQRQMLKTAHPHFVKGTDDLVPHTGSATEVIWPEMNSGVYDVAGGTVAYILDK